MTSRVHARPRLVEVAPPAPPSVVVGTGEPSAAGPVLRLLPPRGVDNRLAGRVRRAPGEVVLTLELPGIGARYLGRVAEAATASGWSAAEAAGLLVELQVRCTYWLAAPRAERAITGSVMRRSMPFRRSAVTWSANGWDVSEASRRGIRDMVAQALERDAVAAASARGHAVPRELSTELAALSAAGVEVRRVREGVARETGGRWAVEALGVPRLDGNLGGLREQFASAPRCGWCALPVIGRRCRRCSPGADR
ncbi:MAG: hypothetical protein QOH74_1222 [Gaiellales bacterium]|nr:hypothetical protein [Gaiellales bacterium]